MPRFAANLSMLFTEVPLIERCAAARQAGFGAVECQLPYACDKQSWAATLQANALSMVLFNLPAGNWDGGERGIGCLPDRIDEFRAGVARAIEYAQTLNCPRLNCLAGIRPASLTPALAEATLIDNLRYATHELGRAGLTLLIEPINTFDIPGFFLTTTRQARALIDKVGAANLKIQYDIYHAQRMEGELANTLRDNLDHIGHIQLADNPGRNEPGSGEINFDFLLPYIDRLGYRGHIGAEYKPAGKTVDGLSWMQRYPSGEQQ